MPVKRAPLRLPRALQRGRAARAAAHPTASAWERGRCRAAIRKALPSGLRSANSAGDRVPHVLWTEQNKARTTEARRKCLAPTVGLTAIESGLLGRLEMLELADEGEGRFLNPAVPHACCSCKFWEAVCVLQVVAEAERFDIAAQEHAAGAHAAVARAHWALDVQEKLAMKYKDTICIYHIQELSQVGRFEQMANKELGQRHNAIDELQSCGYR